MSTQTAVRQGLLFAAQRVWKEDAAARFRQVGEIVELWTHGADPELCLKHIRDLANKQGRYPDAGP